MRDASAYRFSSPNADDLNFSSKRIEVIREGQRIADDEKRSNRPHQLEGGLRAGELPTVSFQFLIELGAGFSYVGKGVPIVVGGDEFEMDLLFYHVILRRYVVIELKTGKFQPKDICQLGFYMTAIDRQMKSKVDGKTLGIVLCRSRNDIVAEYALADLNKPIGVSTYQLGFPSSEQLQAKLKKTLPLHGFQMSDFSR